MAMQEQYEIDQGAPDPNPDFTSTHAPVGQPAQPPAVGDNKPPQERELDPVQAREEAPPETEAQQEEEQEDVLDTIQPKAEPKTWVIGPQGMQRRFIQRPLSFIAKMQWFALVGDVLDKAMSGDDRLSINNLFSAPTGRGGNLSMSDFRDADTFVQAVGKLLVHAPNFLLDSYCIWLAVPDYDRDLVKDMMSAPADEGGLSDHDGMEIIEVFIDQNYEALNSFFQDELRKVSDRVRKRQTEANEKRRQSQPSKR